MIVKTLENYKNNWFINFKLKYLVKSRIIGGTITKPHQYPFICALYTQTVAFTCGATILNENWILTAAHCINKYIENHHHVVHCGRHIRELEIPEQGEQVRTCAKIIIHPEYLKDELPQSFPFDIAVVNDRK